MRTRHTWRLHRGAALLGILALGLALSHVHPDVDPFVHAHTGHATSAGPDAFDGATADAGPSVKSDDDHHEHSSQPGLDLETCFTCRSQHDDDLAEDVCDRSVLAEERDTAGSLRSDAPPFADVLGLPDTRAPPALA